MKKATQTLDEYMYKPVNSFLMKESSLRGTNLLAQSMVRGSKLEGEQERVLLSLRSKLDNDDSIA